MGPSPQVLPIAPNQSASSKLLSFIKPSPEEGVKSHGPDQEHQLYWIAGSVWLGINTHQGLHEQIARNQEVNQHPLMPYVLLCCPTKQWRV